MEKTLKALSFENVAKFAMYVIAFCVKHNCKWDTKTLVTIGSMSPASVVSVNNFYHFPKVPAIRNDKKLLSQWYVLANTVDIRSTNKHVFDKYAIPAFKAVHKMSDKDIKSLITQKKSKAVTEVSTEA